MEQWVALLQNGGAFSHCLVGESNNKAGFAFIPRYEQPGENGGDSILRPLNTAPMRVNSRRVEGRNVRNIGMRWVIVVLALIAASPVVAAEPPGRIDTARSLQSACGPVARSIENPKRKSGVPLEAGLLCLGYMQAMQDMSVLRDADGQSVLGACPSERTKLSDLIRAFVTYADLHPGELNESAAVAVIKSFRNAFPCDGSKAPAGGHPGQDAAEQPVQGKKP